VNGTKLTRPYQREPQPIWAQSPTREPKRVGLSQTQPNKPLATGGHGQRFRFAGEVVLRPPPVHSLCSWRPVVVTCERLARQQNGRALGRLGVRQQGRISLSNSRTTTEVVMNISKLGSRVGLATAGAGVCFFAFVLSIHGGQDVMPFLALSIPSLAAYLWVIEGTRDSPRQKTTNVLLALLGFLVPVGAMMLLGLIRIAIGW
jgi:hypothetical protein